MQDGTQSVLTFFFVRVESNLDCLHLMSTEAVLQAHQYRHQAQITRFKTISAYHWIVSRILLELVRMQNRNHSTISR